MSNKIAPKQTAAAHRASIIVSPLSGKESQGSMLANIGPPKKSSNNERSAILMRMACLLTLSPDLRTWLRHILRDLSSLSTPSESAR